MVDIRYNGSRWYGQQPDTLEGLYEVLRTEPLRPDYSNFSCEVDNHPGQVQFSGNFANVSHAFNIITDDSEVISTLSRLIEENRQSDEYRRAR